MITKSAEERYIDLVKNHSKIILPISLKMVASLLGITDVALSRIRSRLSKRGSESNYNKFVKGEDTLYWVKNLSIVYSLVCSFYNFCLASYEKNNNSIFKF